jgi:predicted small metal-binding protein
MDVCGFAVQGDSVEEVIEHLLQHSKARHGLRDEDVTPEEVSLVRSRVRDVPAARPPRFTPNSRAKPQLLYGADVNGEECLFAIQTDDVEEILLHLRMHNGVRHSIADEGMMMELLEMARGHVRPFADTTS